MVLFEATSQSTALPSFIMFTPSRWSFATCYKTYTISRNYTTKRKGDWFTINYLLGVFPFSWVCLVQNVTASWYECLKQIKPGQKNKLKGGLKLKPFNYQSKVEDISSKHQAFIQVIKETETLSSIIYLQIATYPYC